MKKIAVLFFCCCCISFATADLLAQIGTPCPYTIPNSKICVPDMGCLHADQLSLPCALRIDRVGITGLFGSRLGVTATESSVDPNNEADCYKKRSCMTVPEGCAPSNDPWTTVKANVQVAVPCP